MIKQRDQKAVELFVAYIDAERCLLIFDAEIASLRPRAAWATLPLGLDIVASLSTIEQLPTEPDSGALYEKYLALLAVRRDAAAVAWHAHREGSTRHAH